MTGATTGHRGYRHEAACYGSDEELLAIALPFLLGGIDAGEPTLVALGRRTAALIRAALPADAPVSYLSNVDAYARPTATIRLYRQLLATHVGAGARQIRLIGELPRTALSATWDWWARYESAVNHAYDGFPLWSICAYDTRVTPALVLRDVARTHPRFATVGGRHIPSGGYTDPAVYLLEDRPMVADPLELDAPLADLTDPTPAQARAAVHAADHGQLPAGEMDDLVVAVSEVVTNGLRYGRAPIRFRLWSGADRVVVTITDGGDGPKDPFAGLLPVHSGPTSAGGLGLWITYQSCTHVSMHRGPGSFTVRLTAGNPYPADPDSTRIADPAPLRGSPIGHP